MAPEHFLSDLDEMIAGLAARQQRNVGAIRAMNREPTPVEDARFEVGWGLTQDILQDLNAMRRAWADGQAAYRKTEKMLETEKT